MTFLVFGLVTRRRKSKAVALFLEVVGMPRTQIPSIGAVLIACPRRGQVPLCLQFWTPRDYPALGSRRPDLQRHRGLPREQKFALPGRSVYSDIRRSVAREFQVDLECFRELRGTCPRFPTKTELPPYAKRMGRKLTKMSCSSALRKTTG